LETAVAYMAVFRLGAVALPMSSLFGPDAIKFRINHGEAKAVVCSTENAPKVREALAGGERAVKVIVVGGPAEAGEISYEDALAAASADFQPVETHHEDPAFLIYTSGTTGDPKGALHAHRIAFGQIPAFQAVYEFYPEPSDVFWSPADWAWIAGLMDILVPAWFYGLPIVVDLDSAFQAERAVWLMREFGVTLTLLPPTALRVIRAADMPGGDFSLRAILSGAEVLGADLLKWTQEFFGCTVNEGFGQTEFNGLIGNCASVFPVKPGALGRALPGTIVAVVDEEGNPVIGQEGELAADRNHPLVLLEYWKNPEATKAKFINDWLLTGDLGIQDEDGYFWFVSRKDDVIKSAGYRIGPGEIEGCLGAHEAVAMAAVIGVPDERKGAVPKAFVVLKAGVKGTEELAQELRLHVRTRLAPHEVPRDVVFVDDLPKTTTGKIMRRALRD
jgi:acetyl-CoA synthetase